MKHDKDKINSKLDTMGVLDTDFSRVWEEEETDHSPNYFRSVVEFTWEFFENQIKSHDLIFYRRIVRNLLDGDVIIIRGAYSVKEIMEVRQICKELSEKPMPLRHESKDGAGDYYAAANIDIAKKLSFYRCNDVFYFYRWNQARIFEIANKTWPTLKAICGWKTTAFEKTIPSDGFVDRLHVHFYPAGYGEQEPHQDPYLVQKIIMGHCFGLRGSEYSAGGIYYVNSRGEKLEIEKLLSPGDCYISFPTLVHGVEKIGVASSELENTDDANSGRWFMGFYTIFSDENENKHVGNPFTSNIESIK
jgi:hypothetical protein